MCPAIHIHALIRLLHAKSTSVVETNREFWILYMLPSLSCSFKKLRNISELPHDVYMKVANDVAPHYASLSRRLSRHHSCSCYCASKRWAQQPIPDLGLLVEVQADISPGYPLTRIVCGDGGAQDAVWALPVVTLPGSKGLPPPCPTVVQPTFTCLNTCNTEQVVLDLFPGGSRFQCQDTEKPDRCFSYFLQSLQANTRRIHLLHYNGFLPKTFQVFNHSTIWRYIRNRRIEVCFLRSPCRDVISKKVDSWEAVDWKSLFVSPSGLGAKRN
jgi:hypothetical protein